MIRLRTRLSHAWAVLIGRELALARHTEGEAEAAFWRLHEHVLFATRYMKELPMALIDDIAALGTTFAAALAAKDADAGTTKTALDTANATIADRDKTISDADAAVLALNAQYTPTPAPAPAPAPTFDPVTGLPTA